MAQFLSVLALSLTASGAVPAEKFVDSTGAVATAAGNSLGVSRTTAADGADFVLDVLGTAVVTADGAISNGDELEVGTDGAATVLDAGVKVAVALADAADGEPVEVFLIPN